MNLRTDADKLEKVQNVYDIKNSWNSFLLMSLFLQIKIYVLNPCLTHYKCFFSIFISCFC
jgi:hypothetical protein